MGDMCTILSGKPAKAQNKSRRMMNNFRIPKDAVQVSFELVLLRTVGGSLVQFFKEKTSR